MTEEVLYSAKHWAMKARGYAQAAQNFIVPVVCCSATQPSAGTAYGVELISGERNASVTKGYVATSGSGSVGNGVVVYSDKWMRCPFQTVVVPPAWASGEQPDMVQHDGTYYRLMATYKPFIQTTWALEETIPAWQENTLYEVGDKVLWNSGYWVAVRTHTSDIAFDDGYECIPNPFDSNHSYSVGDKIRVWDGHKWVYYICTTAYTSGTEFDDTNWDEYTRPIYWIRTTKTYWRPVNENKWAYTTSTQNTLQTGDKFYCTTDNKIYTWNGTAWADGQTLGSAQFVFDENLNKLMHLFNGSLVGIGGLD